MNRQTVYPGSIPLDTDILTIQRNAMIALGFLSQAVMGSTAWCAGLACIPTSPASMVVNVAPGVIGQQSVVDETPFGSLAADTADALVKTGINIASTAMSALTAPATSGQSQCWLLEGQMLEADGTPVVLPYYNASNPSQPYSGPSNSGASQNTQRTQTVALQWVAGAPATTGTQAVPAVTSGWVPLYIVTLANGATAINAGNIAVHPASPFIPWALPSLAPGVSRMATITSTGIWTCPAGVYRVRIRIWGGGGPGGNGNSGAGGGGAAGGYFEGYAAVTPGTVYAVTIGASGVAGVSAGGSSSFSSIASATGGGGGGLGPNGPGSTAFGTGIGTGRASLGQSGQNGLSTSAQNTGGQGGSVVDYYGGAAQPVGAGGNATGNNGQIGCGGSGGVGTGAGGNGGAGLVIVEY